MRTIPFSVLAGKIANQLGWKPAELNEKQFVALRDAVSQALAEIWETTWWRDLKRVQRRQFRPDYDAVVEYGAGDEVYYPVADAYFVAIRATTGNAPTTTAGAVNAAYWAEAKTANAATAYSATTTYAVGNQVAYAGTVYQCHTASTGNLPTSTSFWGPVPDFLPNVEWSQSGEEPIGRVRRIWTDDPRTNRNALRLEFESTEEGIQLFDLAVTRPWVEYRPRHHVLSGETWDPSLSYAAETGDLSTVFVPMVSTGSYPSFATVGAARASIITAERVDILSDANGSFGTFLADPSYVDDGFNSTGFVDFTGKAYRRAQRV
jgi:hypothetical protein